MGCSAEFYSAGFYYYKMARCLNSEISEYLIGEEVKLDDYLLIRADSFRHDGNAEERMSVRDILSIFAEEFPKGFRARDATRFLDGRIRTSIDRNAHFNYKGIMKTTSMSALYKILVESDLLKAKCVVNSTRSDGKKNKQYVYTINTEVLDIFTEEEDIIERFRKEIQKRREDWKELYSSETVEALDAEMEAAAELLESLVNEWS